MYDALRTSYSFSCPAHGETYVRLSRFRRLDELPGTHHPAVYSVEVACGCGGEHLGLVTHDELDWAPLGLAQEMMFLNLMTSRTETVGDELGSVAAARIRAGEWPWRFFCRQENRPHAVYPSAFKLLTPADDDRVCVAVECPVCGTVSINVVTREHVDVPFASDREVGVVDRVFDGGALRVCDDLCAELSASAVATRRLTLH